MSRHIWKFLLLFWMFLSNLVCVPSFKSINSSSLYRKKCDRDNFTPTPRERLRGQNTFVGISLIELTEPSDTLNCKTFLKYCVLRTILQAVFSFIFEWKKMFCSKNWAVFYIFLIWFGLVFDVIVLKFLCFWCSFYKVMWN